MFKYNEKEQFCINKINEILENIIEIFQMIDINSKMEEVFTNESSIDLQENLEGIKRIQKLFLNSNLELTLIKFMKYYPLIVNENIFQKENKSCFFFEKILKILSYFCYANLNNMIIILQKNNLDIFYESIKFNGDFYIFSNFYLKILSSVFYLNNKKIIINSKLFILDHFSEFLKLLFS